MCRLVVGVMNARLVCSLVCVCAPLVSDLPPCQLCLSTSLPSLHLPCSLRRYHYRCFLTSPCTRGWCLQEECKLLLNKNERCVLYIFQEYFKIWKLPCRPFILFLSFDSYEKNCSFCHIRVYISFVHSETTLTNRVLSLFLDFIGYSTFVAL